MRRLLCLCTLATSLVALLSSPAQAEWYAYEAIEISPIYPLVNGLQPGDSTWVSHGFVEAPFRGVAVWARATRPAGSTANNQLTTAHDVNYEVLWAWLGPEPVPQGEKVHVWVTARADAFAGTSALLMTGGGDFGAVGIQGVVQTDASTNGKQAPATDGPKSFYVVQNIFNGAKTCKAVIHPTAGVTKPGDYQGYGKIEWIAVLPIDPNPGPCGP
ncbi:MAG: hypothetical protein ACK47B_17480 [Armatimonadota bacterium]